MRRNLVGLVAGLALAALTALPAMAQETATPMYKAPYRGFTNYEFGGDLSFPDGTDFALEGFYQFANGPHDFGLRAGVLKCGDGCTQFNVGGNFRTRVLRASQQFPLDGALTVGFGGRFGEGQTNFIVPVGVSLGRQLRLENSTVRFTPFIHPVIAPVFGDGEDDVDFGVGLGVDIMFSRYLTARVSGGIGDNILQGIGIGLAFTR
ncbi:MAG TPA: outer membrane beta-barrel protein [Gemmatimonadales bacterium]|nr:outer membrane beta-barrel protein [Gemmatimonadales bacterium]